MRGYDTRHCMKYHTHTLSNGLRIVLVPMPENRTATVIVMSGTGSRYENEHENGLAHFLEHMFFKGTKKRPSARAISEELDTIGSVYNAFTSKERTAYYAKVSSRYLETALDVISDIFLNSTLPQKEIKKERGAIIQEIDMYEDMPMRTVDNVFDALMFGREHPLGRTILGPKENIMRFSRKDFAIYLKRNYTPLNTVVCVAGTFSKKKVLAKIKKDFGGLKHGNPPNFITFSSEQNAARVAIKEKKTDQTNLMIGVQAGVEHAKLEKTVKTILAEFKKIKSVKVSNTELGKAKSYMKGNLALSLETSDEIAQFAATSMINLGRIRPLSEILEGIEAVSADDIERVARDILRTEKLNFAVLGPHLDKNRFTSLLHV